VQIKIPKKKKLSNDAASAYLLILPFFVFFTLFVLYPIVQNLFNSFTNNNLVTGEFIGLANYTRLLRDKSFMHSVSNTFIYAAVSIVPLMALGFLAALCVNRQTKAMFAARALLIYPYVASMVSVSMIWLYMYEPGTGLFNKLLQAAGLPLSDWLFNERLALPCLIIMNIWKNMGYVMIIYLAALQSVPPALYDAGRVDGAGFFRRTWHITLPSIRPVSFFLLSTLSIECFKTFEQVRIMTNGGPVDATTTITHQIYMRAFSEFKMGYASSMSVVLFILILAITMVNLKFGGQLGRTEGEG
jgi:ABC-type sugar transport system permease subunit